MMNRMLKKIAVVLVILMMAFTSCSDDPESPNKHVNDWIYSEMDFWYLWNNEIPSKTNKSLYPEDYFESLLSDEDRFSWIQEDFIELLNSLSGINTEAGYEIQLYYADEVSNDLIGQVLYVKSGSPAESAGLKRGDVITHINDTKLTYSNYISLLSEISENHNIRYTPLNVEEEEFGAPVTIDLNAVEFAENPNFLNTIIEQDGHKIGYYVYNFFAPGPTDESEQYNNEMENIFAEFKSEGITDLIIDLRYNSGGAESATVKLASLIGKTVNGTKVFAKRTYNPEVNQAIINEPGLGPEFLKVYFDDEAENVGSLLNNDRVYILTSGRTASASELLINGLRPYMEVFLIGDVTVGKNVGSISIYEENDPKNTWGMQPIVVQSSNALDNSDYASGFVPNILQEDNSLYIYPLGDEQELLLSIALNHIAPGGSRKPQYTGEPMRSIKGKSSLELKRKNFNLNLDTKLPTKLFPEREF